MVKINEYHEGDFWPNEKKGMRDRSQYPRAQEGGCTSDTSWLWLSCFLDFMILTMQASISCFLSSSTFFLVSLRSGSASPCLALACWIFTLKIRKIAHK